MSLQNNTKSVTTAQPRDSKGKFLPKTLGILKAYPPSQQSDPEGIYIKTGLPEWSPIMPDFEKPVMDKHLVKVPGGWQFVKIFSDEQLADMQSYKEKVLARSKEDMVIQAEVARLADRFSTEELPASKKISKPTKAVKPDLGATALEEDLDRTSEAYWQKRCQSVETKLNALLVTESVTRRLTDEVKSLAPKSYDASPPNYITPKNIIATSPQSAVLLFSDTHIGKTVTPEQTMEFGEYNMQVFLDRLQLLQDSTINIISNHVSSRVSELVIVMLGDMLDGGLQHGNEIDQTVSKFGQFYAGGHAIAQFFRNMATKFPSIRIETCVGNHPRWDNQKKMPTKYRFSNLDMFLYAYVQSLTSDIPNISWNLNQQPFQRFTVQTSTFFAAHGDHLRGGDKALGIPSHAISRQLSNIAQLLDKQDVSNPDYYTYGHFHRSMQLPHTRGKIFVNGAFPGVDEYALTNNFVMSDPEQTLMLVHPKYKAVDNWPIQLKFAEPGSSNFVIPQHFD